MVPFLPLLPHSGHEGKGRGYNWGTKAKNEYHAIGLQAKGKKTLTRWIFSSSLNVSKI